MTGASLSPEAIFSVLCTISASAKSASVLRNACKALNTTSSSSENGRSVSRWLAELLEDMRRGEAEYDLAMERYLARRPRKLNWIDGRKPTRDELHDRSGLH